MVLPIVIALQQEAVAIAQFEGGIGQSIRDSRLSERRSYRANQDVGLARSSAKNEAADEHVVASADETARADVSEKRVARLVQIVDFDQSHAGRIIPAAHDRGVSPWGKRGHDGGLEIGTRSEPVCLKLRG